MENTEKVEEPKAAKTMEEVVSTRENIDQPWTVLIH